MNTMYFTVQPSFKLCFDVRVDSYDATAPRRSVRKIKIARYTVGCTVNVILKSKQGFLSKSDERRFGSVFQFW